MGLDLENERFTPSGGIDGRAARRAMGKPDIQFWELFLRETLQNSWDAKRPDANMINFAVDAVMFSPEQASVLRQDVFAVVPGALRQFQIDLSSKRIHALVVSDGGTRGLGGVTRADGAAVPGEPRDYVDFLRNVGRASSKTLGGGTYGFGKGVLYDASSIDTCIVYSQAIVGGEVENRLVVSAVREQFEWEGGRYTGRHWWGTAAADGVVDPLIGPDARSLAQLLGLAKMPMGATGTVICVLEPKVQGEDESLAGVVAKISAAANRWAWPHTVDIGHGPTINFAFSSYGAELARVNPADDPVLKHYVRAYEKAVESLHRNSDETQWPWTTRLVEMLRPKQALGILAYRNYALDEDTPNAEIGHHVALMRNPRFVVKYLPIAEDVSGQATAAVFVASPDANDDFAKSEPVAHDDWVPQGGRSNPVKVALDRIRSEFKTRSLVAANGSGSEHASGVALVSRLLGSVLSGAEGSGAEIQLRREKSARAASNRSSVSIRMGQYPALVFHNGELLADFYFKLDFRPEVIRSDFALDANVKVVLDGGAVEDLPDVPDGGRFPEVFGWYSDGLLVSTAASVAVPLMAGESLVLRVRQPSNVAVTAVITSRSAS